MPTSKSGDRTEPPTRKMTEGERKGSHQAGKCAAPASAGRTTPGLGCRQCARVGPGRGPQTHRDLERGVGQELGQAVAAALVTVPHPHLVLPRGPLGPCRWGQGGQPTSVPTHARQATAPSSTQPGRCAETMAADLGRDQHVPLPRASSSYPMAGSPSSCFSPRPGRPKNKDTQPQLCVVLTVKVKWHEDPRAVRNTHKNHAFNFH